MWDISQNGRIMYGCGKIREIAEIFKWYGLKKIFIVVYSSDAAAVATIQSDLKERGIEYIIYDKVKSEPDLYVIDEGADLLVAEKCDGVLAIGGGSVLDAAKAVAMLATNGGKAEEYQMNGKTIDHDTLPLIAVPTTSGTGSEATRVSVIYNNHNGLKKSIYSPCMIADIAVLDPEVTAGLPAGITATTGMDALSHAIESYVSLNANAYTEMYSLKAMELINSNLERAVANGKDMDARSAMMLGSYMAGCALTAGIGIAHIVAQPLGGTLKIPHGDVCSIFLPLSMEINLEYSLKRYARIGEALGFSGIAGNDSVKAEYAIKRVREMIDHIGTPKSIDKYLQGNAFDMDQALKVVSASTGHITCNPRPVTAELLSEIIQKAM